MVDYDPIKDRLGRLAERSPLLTRAFFRALDGVFLRAWYLHRVLRRLLAVMPDAPVHVLDAGTGFGQHAYWLLRQDPRVHVTAVDVKDEYLERAERFFSDAGLAARIDFRHADLTAQPLSEATFDLAMCVDVLEHIEDDEAALRNIARSLREGGLLVVNTPSDRGGSDAPGEGEGFIGEHVRDGYSPADLQRWLEAAGFEVTEWTYTYGRYGALAWNLLVKQPISMLNRSWMLLPLLVPYYAVAGPLGLALNAADLRSRKSSGTGLVMLARRR